MFQLFQFKLLIMPLGNTIRKNNDQVFFSQIEICSTKHKQRRIKE